MKDNKKVCLITGVAGFIGSKLAERLIKEGYRVRGIDCLLKNYSLIIKKNNLKSLVKSDNFDFVKANLLHYDLNELLEGVDYIFHLAGQPGVRDSWGMKFNSYLNNNVLSTQRLLEAAKGREIKKVVFASSSSIYGDAESFPTTERAIPRPISPYGVTKLAAEQLCLLYYKNFNLPTIALRYFTVYGPRQRPDLFFHKLIKAAILDKKIEVYGDGNQTRSFTYVDDIVSACILAMNSTICGEVFNIGGGARVSVNKAIEVVEQITGKKINIIHGELKKGDARHTCASIAKARKLLGYYPKTRIKKGLYKEYLWLRKQKYLLK